MTVHFYKHLNNICLMQMVTNVREAGIKNFTYESSSLNLSELFIQVSLGSKTLTQYTTSIKQPRFGHLSKFLPIVLMKISSPDSDLAPKH